MSVTHVAVARIRGGPIGWVSARLRTFVCGLGGHDVLLNFEPRRLSLRCTSCPYETPGWTLEKTVPLRELGQRRRLLIEQRAQ